MPCLFQIFSQSDYLSQIVDNNSHIEWQTVQIQINWLHRSQLIWIYTVFKGSVYPGSVGLGLNKKGQSARSIWSVYRSASACSMNIILWSVVTKAMRLLTSDWYIIDKEITWVYRSFWILFKMISLSLRGNGDNKVCTVIISVFTIAPHKLST